MINIKYVWGIVGISLLALIIILFNCDWSKDSITSDENYNIEPASTEGDAGEEEVIEETDDSSEEPVYTEEELKYDETAPSRDPEDYNEDGEFVPKDGPSDDPADYNSDGEYKPVEDMTQEEIEQELTDILDKSINGK
jgi:hypothetical protein